MENLLGQGITEHPVVAPFPDGIVRSHQPIHLISAAPLISVKVKVTVKNTFIEIAEDGEGAVILSRSRSQSVATF